MSVLAAMVGAASAAPASVSTFTTEQAQNGKVAFTKHCASCHMPDLSGDNDVPQLAGANFMATWRHRSTNDLFDYMSGAMPPGGESLAPETYAAITAFILQSNGAHAGDTPLDISRPVTIESLVDGRGAGAGPPASR